MSGRIACDHTHCVHDVGTRRIAELTEVIVGLYTEVRIIHVTAALTSGGLFVLRGIGVQRHAGWPMAAPVRYLSYGIDTLLLLAAATLVSMLPHAFFANGWLTVKLCLVVVYIACGIYALRRGRSPAIRVRCFVAALVTYAFIIVVAGSHDPLGPFRFFAH